MASSLLPHERYSDRNLARIAKEARRFLCRATPVTCHAALCAESQPWLTLLPALSKARGLDNVEAPMFIPSRSFQTACSKDSAVYGFSLTWSHPGPPCCFQPGIGGTLDPWRRSHSPVCSALAAAARSS